MTGPVDVIGELFAGEGAQDYLGEEVSVAVHMRQAGTLAEAAGARATQVAAFEALPHAQAAVAVRRWDEEAKDPGAGTAPFGHFEPLLRSLIRRPAAGSGR